MSKKQIRIINLLVLLLLCVVYVLPLFSIRGIAHFRYQDTYFHLSRIIGLDNVWKSPVNFNNFNHHGTMMNSFYPWLTVYPMFFLYKITNNLVLSYKLFYLLLTIVTMLISYFSVYKMKNDDRVAFLFSLIYTFATYRTVDIFTRAAMGEAVALTFLPLVLLGCYMIFFGEYNRWYYLTIGMTLVLYTHLLSVVMISGIIFVSIIVSFYFWNEKIERLKNFFLATLWTIILSAGFLVPFIQQSIANNLKVPIGRKLFGIKPSDLLMSCLNNDSFDYTVGFVVLVFSIITFISFSRKSKYTIDQGIFFFGLILLFISTSLFPWHLLVHSPVNKIQFVWRLNSYSTLLLSYGISLYLGEKFKIQNRKKHFSKLIFISLVVILHASSTIDLFTQHNFNRITPESAETLAKNYNHTDYANEDSINYPEFVLKDKFTLNNDLVDPETSYTNSVYSIKINSPSANSNLITPIYKYLGQEIYVNDKLIKGKLSEYGTTEVPLKKGISIIKISYSYTLLAKLSAVLSLVALLFIIWKIFVINRNNKSESQLIEIEN